MTLPQFQGILCYAIEAAVERVDLLNVHDAIPGHWVE